MRSDKYNRAMAAFGPRANIPSVVEEVLKRIPASIIDKLTGVDVGQLMASIDKSYHAGRASCGADVVNGGCDIWIDKLQHLYDMRDIEKLTPAAEKR